MTDDTRKGSHKGRTPLEEARLAKGLNREELAAAAGVGFRTVYRAEKRKVTPRRATLFALATALGLSAADLQESDRRPCPRPMRAQQDD